MLSTNRLLTKATPAVIGFAMALGCSAAQAADTWPPFGHRALITEPTDEANRLTLSGNTRPEAVAENDRGSVADNLRLEHMILQSPDRRNRSRRCGSTSTVCTIRPLRIFIIG
jgi:hypothetical protein